MIKYKVIFLLLSAFFLSVVAEDWQTFYEKSGYKAISLLEYCEKLQLINVDFFNL